MDSIYEIGSDVARDASSNENKSSAVAEMGDRLATVDMG